MKKKNKIIVWNQFDQTEKEEEQDQREIPVFSRTYDVKLSRWQQIIRTIVQARHHIIAVFSALAIGTIIGFIMLSLLSNIGQSYKNPEENVVSIQKQGENEKDRNDKAEETETKTIEKMNHYVIQAGVFQKNDSLPALQQQYEKEGFPVQIWEREGKYYAFAGVFQTEELARLFAEEMKQKDLDVFVKDWQTDDFQVEGTKAFLDWIEAFHELLNQSIEQLEQDGKFDRHEWEKLYNQHVFDDEWSSSLKDIIADYVKHAYQDDTNSHLFLLNIWKNFAK